MITLKRTGNGSTIEVQYKTLDMAMKRAAHTHDCGKGYTTTVIKANGTVVAELCSNAEPVVHDERYLFVPVPTGDWRKRPTRYSVYKRI